MGNSSSQNIDDILFQMNHKVLLNCKYCNYKAISGFFQNGDTCKQCQLGLMENTVNIIAVPQLTHNSFFDSSKEEQKIKRLPLQIINQSKNFITPTMFNYNGSIVPISRVILEILEHGVREYILVFEQNQVIQTNNNKLLFVIQLIQMLGLDMINLFAKQFPEQFDPDDMLKINSLAIKVCTNLNFNFSIQCVLIDFKSQLDNNEFNQVNETIHMKDNQYNMSNIVKNCDIYKQLNEIKDKADNEINHLENSQISIMSLYSKNSDFIQYSILINIKVFISVIENNIIDIPSIISDLDKEKMMQYQNYVNLILKQNSSYYDHESSKVSTEYNYRVKSNKISKFNHHEFDISKYIFSFSIINLKLFLSPKKNTNINCTVIQEEKEDIADIERNISEFNISKMKEVEETYRYDTRLANSLITVDRHDIKNYNFSTMDSLIEDTDCLGNKSTSKKSSHHDMTLNQNNTDKNEIDFIINADNLEFYNDYKETDKSEIKLDTDHISDPKLNLNNYLEVSEQIKNKKSKDCIFN